MKYNLGDSWDGFDGGEYVFDERKEKSFHSGIWKVLLGLLGLILIYLVTDHVKEISLVRNGKAVEAQYDADKFIASFRDESGMYHTYNLSDYYPAHEDGMVRLYYMNNIGAARPRNTLSSRLRYYAIFGGLFVVCLWRIRKNH